MTGSDVYKLRMSLGMTQEDMARSLGVALGTVQRWEQKRGKPSKLARRALNHLAATVKPLFDALHSDPDE